MSRLLKERLENWAPEPPLSVWQGVEEALLQDDHSALGHKLYNFGTPPPDAVWEKIEQSLDGAAPVIQLTPRRIWMRYAAGVAAAALVLYFGISSLQSNTASPDMVQQSIVLPKAAEPIKSTTSASPAGIAVTEPDSKPKPDFYSYKSKVPQITGNALTLARAEFSKSNSRLYDIISAKTPLVDEQHLERYMVVTTAEEAAVKLPKKIYDLFRCEEVPDKLACEQRLDDLRMQAAAPSLIATADFTGLLEMVQHVK